MFGPIPMGERQRYIVFLPHPNAHMKRTFDTGIGGEKLQVLRAFFTLLDLLIFEHLTISEVFRPTMRQIT